MKRTRHASKIARSICLCAFVALMSGARADCATTPANQGAGSQRFVQVFIDKSASAAGDRALYEASCARIISALHAGDCVRFGLITGASLRDASRSAQCCMPPRQRKQNMLLDSTLRYRTETKRLARADSLARAELRLGVGALMVLPSSPDGTAIFETLRVAAQRFAAEPSRTKVLIMLSDMIETSMVDFERDDPAGEAATRLIEDHRRCGLLPDLAGVEVRLVGIRGSTLPQTVRLEQFWRQYLTAAGADVARGGVGRVPELAELND